MGFFKKLGDIVSRPVRGIGRIVRGKFREGIADIAHGAKYAAAFVPGVGPGMAAAIGAGAGALERGAERGFNVRNMAQGAVGGAAAGLAGEGVQGLGRAGLSAVRGIGSRVAGNAAPSAMTAAGSVPTAPPALSVGSPSSGLRLGMQSMPGVARSVSAGLPSVTSPVASVATSAAGTGAGQGLGGIGKMYLASQGLGAAAQAYGAQQMGKAEDRRAGMEEEGVRRDWEQEDARNRYLDPIRQQLLEKIMAPRPTFDEWQARRSA